MIYDIISTSTEWVSKTFFLMSHMKKMLILSVLNLNLKNNYSYHMNMN